MLIYIYTIQYIDHATCYVDQVRSSKGLLPKWWSQTRTMELRKQHPNVRLAVVLTVLSFLALHSSMYYTSNTTGLKLIDDMFQCFTYTSFSCHSQLKERPAFRFMRLHDRGPPEFGSHNFPTFYCISIFTNMSTNLPLTNKIFQGNNLHLFSNLCCINIYSPVSRSHHIQPISCTFGEHLINYSLDSKNSPNSSSLNKNFGTW